MLSKIEFRFKDHLNIDRNPKPRVKLNNKKLKYIVTIRFTFRFRFNS